MNSTGRPCRRRMTKGPHQTEALSVFGAGGTESMGLEHLWPGGEQSSWPR